MMRARHSIDLYDTIYLIEKNGRSYVERLMAKLNIFRIFNEVTASNLAHPSLTASVSRPYSRTRFRLVREMLWLLSK
jgi:hypothetical protein